MAVEDVIDQNCKSKEGEGFDNPHVRSYLEDAIKKGEEDIEKGRVETYDANWRKKIMASAFNV